MGFADEVKNKAEVVGDKADDALSLVKVKAEELGDRADDALDDVQAKTAEVLETVKAKAGELIEGVNDKLGGDDTPAPAEPPMTDEPVEDFAAAGPAVPEPRDDAADAVDEEAEELERHSQPGQL